MALGHNGGRSVRRMALGHDGGHRGSTLGSHTGKGDWHAALPGPAALASSGAATASEATGSAAAGDVGTEPKAPPPTSPPSLRAPPVDGTSTALQLHAEPQNVASDVFHLFRMCCLGDVERRLDRMEAEMRFLMAREATRAQGQRIHLLFEVEPRETDDASSSGVDRSDVRARGEHDAPAGG